MKKFLTRALLLLAVLAVGVNLYQLGYGIYRNLSFDPENCTDAQRLVKEYADANGYFYSDYPESLIELLDRNPETEKFVLEYPAMKNRHQKVDFSEYENTQGVPLFMQWDQRWGYIPYGSDVAGITGCGPLCLSMAAYYLTGSEEMSPEKILRFAVWNGYCVPGNGTSWTLISEGGEKLGLDVTEIPLDENRIAANLKADNPIICVLGPGDFTSSGHYIVMTGYEDGMIQVNDPNSIANSRRLWSYEQIKDQILNLWVIRNQE